MGRLRLDDGVLLFAAVGVACTAVLLTAQTDLSSLNWPLLAVPLVAVAAFLVASGVLRGAAAAVMCAWCCLAALSVGIFFAPCAVAMVLAGRRS